MTRRVSARALITILTAGLTALTVTAIVAAVRSSLAGGPPASVSDAVAAAWTVGLFVIGGAALIAWWASGVLMRPFTDLRRQLLAPSERSTSPARFEIAEAAALRLSMSSLLIELELAMRTADAERQRLLGMFEAISEGIVQLGPGARFLHANGAARALLSLPANVEGQPASALVRHPELRDLMERAARGEDVRPTEVLFDNRQLLVAPKPLRASQGETGGAVMTIVELTELRRLESVRRDFVANVSHELKTPLTSIRGYTETLLSDDMPREAQLQFLEVVHKNAARIQRIVDELLDLSRLQSGGWQPELHTVEMGEIARDVWSACSEVAEKKGINFSLTGGPAYVRADAGGLRQILSNLFDNAIRYTSQGGHVRVFIRADAGAANDLVELEIRDDGIGIPGDALPRIFERFFRVDPSRSRDQGGTGLGLSIVKHLVDRMAGDVTAESELGKGTSIRIRLPAATGS